MIENKLLRTIRSGQPAFGPNLWTGNPAVVEVMGQFPFQWMNIDVEHTPYASYELVEHLCRAADLSGLTAIASIPSCDTVNISKLSEVGVMGFIVGHTITEEDANKSINAAKYPPAGRRGAAPTVRQLGYPLDAKGWLNMADQVNNEIAIIGKIEDVEALQNLDTILSTEIDGLMVGAFDLSISISVNHGIPEARANVAHPDVVKARNLIIEKCKQHGKFAMAVMSQLQAETNKTAAEVVEEWMPKGVMAYYLSQEFAILGEWYDRICKEIGLR